MDRAKLCEFSDEILKKKFYDCMLNSFLPDNISKSPGALLNGYFAEILTINTTNPKYFRSPSVYHSPHRKSHKHSKDYALHHFQDQFLEDIPEEQPEVGSVLGRCPDHANEKLRYFCETCDEPICLDCTSTDHRKHRFSYLREVYHKQKHSMASLLGQGKTQIENTRKSLNEVKNLLSKLQEERESMAKTIRENTQILIASLQQQEDQLLDELNGAFKSKESSLRKERQYYELILERLSGSCQYTEKAIKIGNELEILVIQKHLKRRLSEVSNTRKDYNSADFKNVYYFSDPKSTENVRKALGHIIVSDTSSDLSTATGDGLVKAQVGAPAEFVVTAKGFDDQPKTRGGDLVTIDIRSPSKNAVSSEVLDKGDGSYAVAFTPSLNGEHEVRVAIHHQPVKGSPFKVLVTNPRVYSKVTRPLLCIGGPGEVRGKFKLPCGVAVDSEGRILVADCHNHRLQIFDPQGRFFKSFGNLGEKNGQLNNPTDVAVDKQGNIIVCDKDNHRIQRFTKDGVFINKFGGFGENQGKLKRPWGVSIGNDDEIIVTDRKNSRIQIFREDGSLIRVFGCHGHASENLDQPYHAIMDSKGDIFVTDSNNHAIKVFDCNGNFLREIGVGQSMLKYPTGIAFDMDDHVIVSDQYNHRIQIFNKDGCLEASLASAVNGMGQKCYPKGVAVTPGGYIVVADSDSHRVIVL
ncbi:E3 ubiquitin-protein ligase TRIM71-like [Montipora capricornis]|uniref:E3 ubiquitin-protein ligase TRIM71-like n=1 Tax=Montipora capricornis TaxID=246305 RepID=UPI0035F186D6